jgi:hypothetical protein
MDEGLSAAVLKVFVRLYKEGLIYKDKRLVNWDPHFETAISDLEVENREVNGHFWHFKYPLENGESYHFPIAPIGAACGVEIVVHAFENLLIHCAEDVNASVVIRGLRAVSDFEYEFQMVGMNRAMNDSIETVFLMADAHHQAIASRLVKEIARLGGDVTGFVPARVATALAARFGGPAAARAAARGR